MDGDDDLIYHTPSFEADKSGADASEACPPIIVLTLDEGDNEEEGSEGDNEKMEDQGGEVDDREGVSGEGSSGVMNGGNGKSGDVEGDSGGMDGGEDNDGEQIENTIDIRFNLLQWDCILFVRLQLRFGLTNAAATEILAFVSLLLGLITHPLYSMFPTNLPGLKRIESLDNFTEKQVFIVCPNDSCNSLY